MVFHTKNLQEPTVFAAYLEFTYTIF